MPPIGVHIAPESGDLVHDVVDVDHSDGAELNTHRHGTLEKFSHLLWLRRGGEVPIEMGMAEKGVAHGPTHAPGLVAGLLETLGDAADCNRWTERLDRLFLLRFRSTVASIARVRSSAAHVVS